MCVIIENPFKVWKFFGKCWWVSSFTYIPCSLGILEILMLWCNANHPKTYNYSNIPIMPVDERFIFPMCFPFFWSNMAGLWMSCALLMMVAGLRASWTSACGEWGHQQCEGHLPLHHCRPLWLYVWWPRLGLWLQVSDAVINDILKNC